MRNVGIDAPTRGLTIRATLAFRTAKRLQPIPANGYSRYPQKQRYSCASRGDGETRPYAASASASAPEIPPASALEIIHAALASGELPAAANYEVIGPLDGFSLGQPTRESAQAARDALEQAVAQARAGERWTRWSPARFTRRACMRSASSFQWQTEFFAARCGVEDFAMLLTGRGLTVALVTTHIPLREVVEQLRTSEIVRVGRLLAAFLARRGQKRIAVAGLNPHAGESSARSATKKARPDRPGDRTLARDGISAAGPFSPDTIFHRAVAGEFDAVLCMYHDQGLIPLQAPRLPRRRERHPSASPSRAPAPDHGTAFEIAGQRIARPDSMIAAFASP